MFVFFFKMGVEEVEKREQWGNQLDFILSCLGYAVGLGNVWRFPYLCGKSGGAAFFIPYFIMMIFAGFPVFYMELAIGQYAALSPHLLYRKMCPLFAGIGYCMILISMYTGIYYNMIIAWSIYYMCASFKFSGPMPWMGCGNTWNTIRCYDDIMVQQQCSNATQFYFAGRCHNNTEPGASFNNKFYSRAAIGELLKRTGVYNEQIYEGYELRQLENRLSAEGTLDDLDISTWRRAPAKEYNNYVLGIVEHETTPVGTSDFGWQLGGIEEYGLPKWDLVICLLAAWVLIFFCLMRGVKSSGKVVYFTATFPYVVLLILFFKGISLDGAGDGINFYLNPNMKYVGQSSTWSTAANQIFFSLSLGGGGLTTLASYNSFNNNLLRDTIIVVIGNCATSVFAGFVIFPIIGFVAKQTGEQVAKIAASGPTLAFVAYPNALGRLPPAWLWSILFFFMLILLGIDSQLVIVEVVVTAITDQWPRLREGKLKAALVGLVCTVSFILGLSLTCPGGPYLLNVVDSYAGGWTLVMACLIEVCMVSYVYGIRRFVADIRLMMGAAPNAAWRVLGYPTNWYWYVCWVGITPLLLTFVLLFSFIDYEPITYDEYSYPVWGDLLGWAIALSAVLWIPGYAIYLYIRAQIPHCSHLYKWLVTPTVDWKPAIDQNNESFDMKAVEVNRHSGGGGQGNPAYSSTAPPARVYPHNQSSGQPPYVPTPTNRSFDSHF